LYFRQFLRGDAVISTDIAGRLCGGMSFEQAAALQATYTAADDDFAQRDYRYSIGFDP